MDIEGRTGLERLASRSHPVCGPDCSSSAGYAAINSICDYYQSIQDRPVKSDVKPGYLLETLPDAAPTDGEPFEKIAADFQSLIMPGITHWQHPKFMAYFPAISTYESMLGELYSSSVSNPGFNWICSPACTELEQVMMDWMAKMLGLSDEYLTISGVGGGIILGSASESALTAAMAARERALHRLTRSLSPADAAQTSGSSTPIPIREQYTQKMVIYGSTQTHSLGAKAALLLGMQFRAVPVSRSDDYSLRGHALREVMERDVKEGLIPFFVIATVGTTSSGAVDNIAEIGKVLKAYPTAFLHVDAAWAGVAYALPDHRKALRLDDVNQFADSFCTNAHKWGLTGFDCSLFWIKDRGNLTEAFDVTPAFLRSKESDAGSVIDYRNWQIALGRRFRSIKLWFVLRSFGVTGFQQHLAEGIEHCQQLASIVNASANFEIVTPPSLALLVVRLRDPLAPNSPDEVLNRLNQALYARLDARHDVMLTQTVLKSVESEVHCLRIAMGGVNTTMKDVQEVWEVIESEGRQVLEEYRSQRELNV
ncbi:hypothetical protein EHS25_005500 [Saitozyma podzolica]|uniref:Aromatic-L-amino-acid decarboxylase n=1 Tax=Saitozyma podzolica TaxID=1890683 RepID=A0A427XYU3_9TREE|nr:hypothetical protein EHS25_005500 [Saitozyma podzolica]